ncbi:hypothetical protein [Chryseobacterium sp.]|uniref:hypothetical protein n=1 Tax=Chryseobacterium sp. TaxID=1871047 RepID=UPI0025C36B82|nr:hypothetical protein [Chryseobacterium sp.]MBV8325171.1 hypothetical protein [Chryseobacterium sp.]
MKSIQTLTIYTVCFCSIVFIIYHMISMSENGSLDWIIMVMIGFNILPLILFLIIYPSVCYKLKTLTLKVLCGGLVIAWVILPLVINMVWHLKEKKVTNGLSAEALTFVAMPFMCIVSGFVFVMCINFLHKL